MRYWIWVVLDFLLQVVVKYNCNSSIHVKGQLQLKFSDCVAVRRVDRLGRFFSLLVFVVFTITKTISPPVTTIKDLRIRNRIVITIDGDSTRERLLREDDLTLDKASRPTICRAAENAKKHSKTMCDSSRVNINDAIRNKQSKQNKIEDTCDHCGQHHRLGRCHCPAEGQICRKCKRKNNSAVKCRTVTSNERDDSDSFSSNDSEALHTFHKKLRGGMLCYWFYYCVCMTD